MENRKEQDLLTLALRLHMHANGSWPDMSDGDRKYAREFIEKRLSNWSPSSHLKFASFDEAVRTILVIALNEDRIRGEEMAKARYGD